MCALEKNNHIRIAEEPHVVTKTQVLATEGTLTLAFFSSTEVEAARGRGKASSLGEGQNLAHESEEISQSLPPHENAMVGMLSQGIEYEPS